EMRAELGAWADLFGEGDPEPTLARHGPLALAVLSFVLSIQQYAERTGLEVASYGEAITMIADALRRPGAIVERDGEVFLLRVWLPALAGSEWEFAISIDDRGRALVTSFYPSGADGFGGESTL